MQPDEIEQMLYHRAVRTKIRPPAPERIIDLGYNRMLTSGVIAGAALVCSLVLGKSSVNANDDQMLLSPVQPQITASKGLAKQVSVHNPAAHNDTDLLATRFTI